ncbi:MAG TPA: ABC transporter permease [Acidimicrobiales bacterium]|nr:ABC transporter permease [Acidimicrobiales bacterium]
MVDAIREERSEQEPVRGRRVVVPGWARDGITDPHARRGLYAAAGTIAFLVFVRFVYEAPPAILFNGAVLGSLYGLIAMGLVLVYRSNKIINFAQGDLGGVSGVLMASLIAGASWPFVPALAVSVVAGVAVGALVQTTLIRRFADAPRLILTVVTILVSTILAGVQLIIPQLFDLKTSPQGFPVPFDFFRFRWAPLTFRGSHLLVLLAVPALAAALAWFFARTRLGIAVRASAESADRARLLGIPVKRVNLYVWVIAAGMSAVAAVMRTFIVGPPIGSVLGPTLLFRALAAAVIAKMENLWVAFGAAVAIGVVEEAVFFDAQRTSAVPPVLFAIVLVALVAQSRGTVSRAVDKAQSTWSAVREVRPIPPELAGVAAVRRTFLGGRVLLFAVLVVWPVFLGTGRVNLMSYGVIYGMLALSLVILTGWTGQISLGQWGFAGFGGAVTGVMYLNGWNVLVALLAGGLVGAAVAIAVGIPALRIRGLFLAVATFAFTLAAGSFFLNPQEFSWVPAQRLPLRPILLERWDLETEHAFYYFCLALLGAVLLMMKAIRSSRTGRAMVAVRENERGVQAFGVNAVRTKLVAFAFSGFVAAVAGGLAVMHQHGRLAVQLGAEENLRLFLIAVVGGLGSAAGVLTSVGLFQVVDFFVPAAEVRLLFNGIGVLLILLVYPSGLGGILYDLRDAFLRRVATARGIHVPSLVADSRQADEPEVLEPDEPPPMVAEGDAVDLVPAEPVGAGRMP